MKRQPFPLKAYPLLSQLQVTHLLSAAADSHGGPGNWAHRRQHGAQATAKGVWLHSTGTPSPETLTQARGPYKAVRTSPTDG